jgi:hypothetical protein
VKAYEPETVYYLGDVVTHAGSSWQARKDTGQAPPHADWVAIAAKGTDGVEGRSLDIRGTFDPSARYERLAMVAFNGGTFVAKQDDPGACPGPGWQLIASPGKRGDRGEPGERGPAGRDGKDGRDGARGPKGEAIRLVSWRIDRANYRAVARMSDGSEIPLELRELFEQFTRDIK